MQGERARRGTVAWLGTLEERQKCDGLAEQGYLNHLSLLEGSVC